MQLGLTSRTVSHRSSKMQSKECVLNVTAQVSSLMFGRTKLRDSPMLSNMSVRETDMLTSTFSSAKLSLNWSRKKTHLEVPAEANGDPKAATPVAVAMVAEAAIAVVAMAVATNLKAPTAAQVVVDMVAVVDTVTIMEAPAEVDMAEATMLVETPVPIGEVATKILVQAEAVVMAVAMVVAAAATTTTRRNKMRDPNPMAGPHLTSASHKAVLSLHLVATRSLSATLTLALTKMPLRSSS